MTRRRKTILVVLVSLAGVLLVGGITLWLLLPGIVGSLVTRAVRESTAAEPELGGVEMHGLSGVTLRDLRLTDPADGDREVLYVEEVRVSLDGIPWPWSDTLRVADVAVTRPRVTAVREADGRLNFQRLLTPKPSERKTVVERVAVAGADLRMVFPGDAAMGRSGEDESMAANDGRHGTPSRSDQEGLVELRDVGLALKLVDESAGAYDVAVTVGDEAWGPVALAGHVEAAAKSVVLSTTAGALHLTPETLATLPGMSEAQLSVLKPEATVRLVKLEAGGALATPYAEVEVADIAVTPPGMRRLSGARLTALLEDDRLRVELRDVPEVESPGVGAVGDVTATAVLDLKSYDLAVEVPNASVLGGTIAGKVTVSDIRHSPLLPEGHVDLTGVRLASHTAEATFGLDGRIQFQRVASAEGRRPLETSAKLTVGIWKAMEGEGQGGPEGAPLLRLPVDASASFDPDESKGAIDFRAAVGDAQTPVQTDLAGRLDRAGKAVEFRRSTARVSLTDELLDAVGRFYTDAATVRQFGIGGTVALKIEDGTRMPLGDPLATQGRVSLSSQDFTFHLPGEEAAEKVRLDAMTRTFPKSEEQPAGLEVEVTTALLTSGGNLHVLADLDRGGALQSLAATTSGLQLSGERLKSLSRLGPVPQEVRAAIRELPEFTLVLDSDLRRAPEKIGGEQVVAGDASVTFADKDATFQVKDLQYHTASGELHAMARAEDIRLTSDLARSLRPAVVALGKGYEAHLDRVLAYAPEFGVAVRGTADIHANARTRSFERSAVQVKLSDLSATVTAPFEGRTATFPLTGEGIIDYGPERRAAAVSLGVFGGKLRLMLSELTEGFLGGAIIDEPIRFAALPQAVRDKAPMIADGAVTGAVEAKVAELETLTSSPFAFKIQVRDARITLPPSAAEETPRTVVASLDTYGTVEPANKHIKWMGAGPVALTDASGVSYIPPNARLGMVEGQADLDARTFAGTLMLEFYGDGGPAAGPKKIISTHFSLDAGTGNVSLTDIKAPLDFGELALASRADPVGSYFRPLAPRGTVDVRGSARLNIKADSPVATAVYDLKFAARNLSAVNPQTGVRSPPRDIDADARRDSLDAPHHAHVVTKHPEDGDLDATIDVAGDRFSVDGVLREFVLTPQLIALAGPTGGACKPSGLFDGTVKATLTRGADGLWTPVEMGGELTGSNLSANCPDNELHFQGGLIKVKLLADRIRLETLEGTLADGNLKVSGDLLPTSEDGPWTLDGVKLLLERAKLREFKGVAHRPPNELNGRITIDMASKEEYGFSGPLADLAKLKGRGHATFGEGHLWQLPLFRVLQSKLFQGIAAVLRGKFDPSSFRKAEADFLIADSKVTFPAPNNPDGLSPATVDSDMIRVVIDGDVFFDRRLDLHLASSIRLNVDDRGVGDLIPGLGAEIDRWKKIIEKLPGGDVPILPSFWHVTGTFDEPIYQPDVARSVDTLGGRLLEFLKSRKEEPAPAP